VKLTVLGSGSPEAHVRRASSGYLLELGSDRILFDCGGGVFDNLLRAGHRPGDITHIFLTHLHSDHMMDYARLVHAAWDEGAPQIRVFGPRPIRQITEGYFSQAGVLSHDLRARTELPQSQAVWISRGGTLPRPWPAPEVTEIGDGFVLDAGAWQLTACAVPHAQPFLVCLAFAVTEGPRRFVYSGDSGLCPGLSDLARGADLLLHWCYRLGEDEVHDALKALCPTPAEIARMARAAGVKRLLLTHFRRHMDTPDGHAAALADLASGFRGPAGIAEDLQVHEV
jgi:ribonuclease Z